MGSLSFWVCLALGLDASQSFLQKNRKLMEENSATRWTDISIPVPYSCGNGQVMYDNASVRNPHHFCSDVSAEEPGLPDSAMMNRQSLGTIF